MGNINEDHRSLQTKILELENAIMRALALGDQIAISLLLTEDCAIIDVMGNRITKLELMDPKHGLRLRSFQLTEMSINARSEAITVQSAWDAELKNEPVIVEGLIRISRVWILQAGSWRVLMFHVSDARLSKSWTATKKLRR